MKYIRHALENQRFQKSGTILLILLSTASGISPIARAQTAATPETAVPSASESQNSGAVEEVVVTAQRRSEKVQNVPISVNAFSATQLEASSISSTADLGTLTPGLEFGEQAGYSQPHLRGIGTTAAGPGVENPIALYVDNVYYGAVAGSILSLNSVKQVEVDKGPQGTLFGRNATGGVILVTTKDPSQDFGGIFSANYGNYTTAGTDVYVTGGLTADLAADLAVHFQNQGDGFGKNLVTDQAISKSQDLAVRTKWLLTPSDDAEFKLILDYGQSNYIPDYVAAPGTTPLGAPPFTGSAQDMAGVFQPYGVIHQGGASFHVRYDLDFAQFTSITAFRQTELSGNILASPSVTPTYAVASAADERHHQYTQEFQLSSLSDSRIKWTTGAYFYYADAAFAPFRLIGGLISPLNYLDYFSDQKDYSGAIYGQATSEVAADTNLTLGLRYSGERRNFHGSNVYGFPDGSTQYIADTAHKVFEKPTWRIALDHRFTPDFMVYASYNRGFKSGGFNDTIIPAQSFAPEVLDAYETGAKMEFLDHRARLNTSFFFYDYKNIQVSQIINATQVIYNGASAQLYGIDIDGELKITNNLSLTSGLEIIHDAYTSFPNANISVPAPGGGTNYSSGSANGRRVSLTPDWTFNVAADYFIPTTYGDVILNVTYAYNDGWYAEPDNRLHAPSYSVVNAQVSWTSPDELYSVRAWAKNLTDAQYEVALGSQSNGDFATYAPPRTYGVTISRDF